MNLPFRNPQELISGTKARSRPTLGIPSLPNSITNTTYPLVQLIN